MPEKPTKWPLLRELLIQFSTISCFLAIAATALSARSKPGATTSQTNASRRVEAKSVFDSACASCHGLDARGGERGPDIVSRSEVVRKTDAELLKILTDGKTATGMPSFASYGPAKLSALVSYIRTLQGRSGTPLPGDPARGKALFFGKAKCAECHMVRGQGGFFAHDLTFYAARMAVDDIRAAIINPDKDLDPRRGLITVTLADSTTLSGIARNEDNFSLQLQTPDGAFHIFNKADIKDQTYTGKSPMSSNYGSALSSHELNNLVSYLLLAGRIENARKAAGKAEEEDEDEDED